MKKKKKKEKKKLKKLRKQNKNNEKKASLKKDVKITRYNPSNNVFKAFKGSAATQKLSWKIIDGLYDSTIFNRIVERYTSVAIPPFFNIIVEDENGDRMPELEKECAPLSVILTRELFRDILKAMLIYGTAVVYKGDRIDGIPQDIFLIHPKDIDEVIGEDDHNYGELLGYEYMYNNRLVLIPPEDIAIISNNIPIGSGSIWGTSILNPIIRTLGQLLNGELDMSVLVDQYCIPLLKWSVDTMIENGELIDDEMIMKVRDQLLAQLDAGDDVVTDARVTADVIGFAKESIDVAAINKETRKMLGMITIPEALLGGEADNLSAIRIQSQTFMSDSENYQVKLNDAAVRDFYIPFFKEKGRNLGEHYKSVYMLFPILTQELPSEKIIWLHTSYLDGAITIDQYRMNLGLRGKAPGMDSQLREYYNVTKGGGSDSGASEPKDRSGKDPQNQKNKAHMMELANEAIKEARDNGAMTQDTFDKVMNAVGL